ncbi:hypothetical protein E4T50_15143 [Aureobasidium sp. EXF-12298]|nr:hypothetical protein E4T50_15143 [Aureobasidium sp. EXF-12298]KAI4763713.1 hypothetical protein E4T51_03309 [Aureobasidium sp. EXF-12344]KAI4769461.1 hypothetical protein E4T52_15499 [Aureobasidium sp. EXF-3400]
MPTIEIPDHDHDHDVSPISSPSLSRVNSRNSAVSSLDDSPASSPIFSPTQLSANGHGGATSDTATTTSYDHSFTDADDWFGRFREDLDISDACPDRGQLAVAGQVPVYDANGTSRLFSTFFTGLDAIGDRQFIIFVRHFFCGACQAYMKAIAEAITMQAYYTMAVPTNIIVIGCGSPSMIPFYKQATGCPFPIFADPSRKLYKALGMTLTLNLAGPKRPEYMKDISFNQWQLKQWTTMAKAKGATKFKGGNLLQIGGEFLFQDGQVVWCHRMKNMRGHAEVSVVKRILELED